MTSSVAVRSLPVQKKAKAERSEEMSVGEEGSVNQLLSLAGNGKVPIYMKLVIELLLETRNEMKIANQRNAELIEEIHLLREENSALKQRNASLESTKSDVKKVFANASPSPGNDEQELSRSIVLSHVPESTDHTAAERLAHDFACVNQLLDFLDVECRPTAVYRMGKITQNYPRLIKVVLPASKFQKQAIKRAPRLRFFSPQRGIYLRASLTWEERQRRREERLKRREPAINESVRVFQTGGLSKSPPPSPSLNTSIAFTQDSSLQGNC
ncbi:hypothetical protein Y032_0163g3485 [Ancylostoma ceylanicum]|uniref:Uncharacterized protein n=1 Tax=Ancylostoma ceylanicum TaxID=53326 RepID=A0A016SXD5_9BILA|nr:hypothetical protein Y032_0163g3485 [Ancylostoma ceylanicum]